ncbi:hypothetical protein [Wenzhouxiangella sediminis]|uniref:Uncharacterized protein n=1 Tax=Wenzhouxiangella sediminis TaxID=1792836 RepID=A0A3E1K7L8_9GAMM|nr:hypothetical protein [Wenzhouxiangella sediminis]RFF29949.1 hypothetical protein DZC52_10985 [Wenzhouxiangella sediminis]
MLGLDSHNPIRLDKPANRRSGSRPAAALGALATLLLLFSAAVAAAKPPHQIRAYLLEESDQAVSAVNSVEPFHADAIDDLLTAGVWKVSYASERSEGESLIFMAVHDGEVLRLHRFDQPRSRDALVRLLPDDFRVRSGGDAKRIVSAALALHFGFPFSEPEMTADEMRIEQRGNEYFFVDGERFGDATGYRIASDEDGRVTEFEYSWELPVEPPQD